jgi:hypothetical protein
VCRTKVSVVLILLIALLALVAPESRALPPGTPLPRIEVGSMTYGDAVAREKFDAYVALLESDPKKYEAELATLRQLAASDVEYHVQIVDIAEPGVGGRLTTDGRRVFVNVSLDPRRELGSIHSRLAHELEHARQFDSGELAFERHPATGEWRPAPSSYDIGDEVNAFRAQLAAAQPADYWSTTAGRRKPSLLRLFADARTDAERAEVLARNGYKDRNRTTGCNVVFESSRGFVARQVVRPGPDLHFFGRVYATAEELAARRGGSATPDQIVTLH